MPPAAFLALLTIAMLILCGIRLELNFRRTAKGRPGPGLRTPGPELRSPRPELRAAPAGGYCQTPFPAADFRKS